MARESTSAVYHHLAVDTAGGVWRVALPVAPTGSMLAELSQALAGPPGEWPHVLLLRFVQSPLPAGAPVDGRLNRVRERALAIANERTMSALTAFAPPIVAEVRGEVNELACAILAFADLILASAESRFTQGERGHLGYQARAPGAPVGTLSARQALHAGLINGVCTPARLEEEVQQLLVALQRQDAGMLRQAKRAVILGLESADLLAAISSQLS
jgi:enoyl-CoA hydratase/carnithine racemase